MLPKKIYKIFKACMAATAVPVMLKLGVSESLTARVRIFLRLSINYAQSQISRYNLYLIISVWNIIFHLNNWYVGIGDFLLGIFGHLESPIPIPGISNSLGFFDLVQNEKSRSRIPKKYHSKVTSDYEPLK